MSPYDIIYTKTYALAQIPHTTCAGPSASLGLSAQVLRYLCSNKSQSCRYHTYERNEIKSTVPVTHLTFVFCRSETHSLHSEDERWSAGVPVLLHAVSRLAKLILLLVHYVVDYSRCCGCGRCVLLVFVLT
jgi:hypothetical protein